MTAEIEARYLGIEWQEPGRARRIEAGAAPIEIREETDGVLALESSLFNGHLPWLGLSLGGAAVGETPHLLTATGETRPMMRLEHPADGRTWWVEDGQWDPNRRAHLSELHRSAGTFHVVIGDRRLRIDNVETGLGPEELRSLLDDFRGELLGLVLDPEAAAKGGVAGAGGNKALVDAAAAFAAALRRVLRAPATEIREGTGERPLARLRPKPATFRHHARQPHAPRLASRVSYETMDLPETRYLRHLASTAARLAEAGKVAAGARADFLGRMKDQHRQRAEELRAMRTRMVDPAIFDRQLADIEKRIEALRGYREVTEGALLVRGTRVHITKHYGRGPAFFDEANRSGMAYAVVEVPKVLFGLMRDALHLNRDYTLHGPSTETIKESSGGKSYRLIHFDAVERVEVHGDAVERKRALRARLEANGWVAELSRKELEECRQEARAAERRADALDGRAAGLAGGARALAAAHAGLLGAERAMAGLGIGLRHDLPAGMRFVRDPAYAAALAAWNALRAAAEAAGLDEGLLDGIESVGLLHASDLYEKWCLLRVVRVLVDDFRFRPPTGWQARLVAAAIAREVDLSLVLAHEDLGLEARLLWQHVLPNGRRPDLVLAVRPIGSGSDADSPPPRDLVLDAKFRARWRPQELKDVLDELIKVKRYGEGGRRVFVLHPAADVHQPATSPLDWGPHCTYGQRSPGNHRGGAIRLAPGSGGAPHIHLKRLLALEVQHAFPAPHFHAEGQEQRGEDRKGRWESDSFCVECGERHAPEAVNASPTKAGKTYWTLSCGTCSQLTIRTHCYECARTLFKNGTRLTYHETVADQLTNVVCPCCGAFFDEDLRAAVGADR